MYKDNTIELIWDNSSPIDSQTMGFLSKAGFRPHPVAVGDIQAHISAQQEIGQWVVCIDGRDSSSLDLVQCVIDDTCGDGLLAIDHDAVDETTEDLVIVTRITLELLFRLCDSTGHADLLWLICPVGGFVHRDPSFREGYIAITCLEPPGRLTELLSTPS